MYIIEKGSSVRLGGYWYRPYRFVIAPTSFEESAAIERGKSAGLMDSPGGKSMLHTESPGIYG